MPLSVISHAKPRSSHSVQLYKVKACDAWTRRLQPCSRRLLSVDMHAQVFFFSRGESSKSVSVPIAFKDIRGVELCEAKLRTRVFGRTKPGRPCLVLRTTVEDFELLFACEVKACEWLETMRVAHRLGIDAAKHSILEVKSSASVSSVCSQSMSGSLSSISTIYESDSERSNSEASSCDSCFPESKRGQRTVLPRVAADTGVRRQEDDELDEIGYNTPKFGV